MIKIRTNRIRLNGDRKQNIQSEAKCGWFIPGGLRIRADVHVGAWWCDDCVGKTEGSQLIDPKCDYCRIS